ncbi:type III-B CRISPR module RAMP protein Cmr1 [Pyrofollis japonicus]|uniref:type III-B CRISPR module RAMP protein Cmr1 n=1 Tax=Pyrofollis japonicus TaxID=3060460 RepID=UPI00295B52D2|nr:type III-B CRISPR module RAMP protein Cmr1 [Pyrofollis japonicus]
MLLHAGVSRHSSRLVRSNVLREIARIRVTSSTPLFLGGYDTRFTRRLAGLEIVEPLRTQSIKGVLRWWSRAFLAGALYARGSRGRELVRKVIDLSKTLWGSTESASPFVIRSLEQGVSMCDNSTWRKLSREHQRLRLLQLGGGRLPPSEYRAVNMADIILYSRTVPASQSFYSFASAMLVALFELGCLGKASRRGLGCFDIVSGVLPPWLHSARSRLPSSLSELVTSIHRLAAEIAGGGSAEEGQGLPPVPAIAPGVYRVLLCKLDDVDPVDATIKFSKCVTAQYRKLVKGGDVLRRRLYAWILGLPREQKGTGYKARGVERRASPLIFTVHRGYALLQAFYSSDWPSQIEWIGGHSSTSIRVSDDVIISAMDTAVEFLQNCLGEQRQDLGPSISCQEVKWSA